MYVNIFFSTGSWNAQIQGISIFQSDAFCLSFDSIEDISVLKSAARKKENICNSNCRDRRLWTFDMCGGKETQMTKWLELEF